MPRNGLGSCCTVPGFWHDASVTSESETDPAGALLAQLIDAEKAYRAGDPIMADDEFDELRDQLAAMDSDRDDVESFLNSVAGGQELGDVPHEIKMLSLLKVLTDEDLTKFIDRVGQTSLVVTPKLDGVALAARYKAGQITDIITRGNGELGTSVFHNRDVVAYLPETLPEPIDIEVRGEVVMTHDDMAVAGERRGTPFKNRRNPIGPILNQATKDRTYESPMRFIAFSIAASTNDSLVDDFGALEHLGFMAVNKAPKLADMTAAFDPDNEPVTAERLRTLIDKIGVAMADASFDYLLDGAVISVLREPVQLAGTSVQRASLHNPAIIAALDVRIGDTVVVTKRNEIIPQIVEVVLSERPADSVPYDPIKICPDCGEPLDFSAARPRCLSPTCSLQSRLASAASRNGFDWDGVGKTALGKAVDAGLVNNLADVFSLDAEAWATLEGITDSSTKIVAIINESLKTTRLDHVLGSLGIRFVNRTFARRLAEHFGSIEALRAAPIETLLQVDGIGDGRAEAIIADLAMLGPVLDQLHELGLEPLPMPEIEVAEGAPFAGHKVLVTGTLPGGMKRDEAKEAVRTLGGDPASSVSAKVTRYVVGESAGQAKIDKIEAFVEEDPDRYQVLNLDFDGHARIGQFGHFHHGRNRTHRIEHGTVRPRHLGHVTDICHIDHGAHHIGGPAADLRKRGRDDVEGRDGLFIAPPHGSLVCLLLRPPVQGAPFSRVDETALTSEIYPTPIPSVTAVPALPTPAPPEPTPAPTTAPTSTPEPTATATPTATPTPEPIALDPGVYITQDGELVDQVTRSTPGNTANADLVEDLQARGVGPFNEFSSEEDGVITESIQHVLTTETPLGVVRTIIWTEQPTPSNSLGCHAVIDYRASRSCSANQSSNRLEQFLNGLPGGIAVFNAHPLAEYFVVVTNSGVTVGGPVINDTAVLHVDRRFGNVTDAYLSDRFGQPVRHWWFDETGSRNDGKREDYQALDLGPGLDVEPPEGSPEGDIYITLDTAAQPAEPLTALENRIVARFGDSRISPLFDDAFFVGRLQWDLEGVRRVLDSGRLRRRGLWCSASRVRRVPGSRSRLGQLGLQRRAYRGWSRQRGHTIVAQANEHVAIAIWREIYGQPETYRLLDANLEVLISEDVR
ncbi:DNA ligase 1 [Nymphon striatum]|nr:DNA ligase 1 [Nymphon striatum]